MFFSFRLGVPVERDLSLTRTLIGIALLTVTSLVMTAFTILTKGMVYPTTPYTSYNFITSNLNCTPATLYPGQTFGSIDQNSSFLYVSQASTQYKQDPLSDCQVNGTVDLIFHPMDWPQTDFRYNVSCKGGAGMQDRLQFGIQRFLHNSNNTSPSARKIWGMMIAFSTSGFKLNCGSGFDANTPIAGFSYGVETIQTSGDEKVVLLSDSSSDVDCLVDPKMPLTSSNLTVATFYDEIKSAILEDVGAGILSPLPGITYDCTSTVKEWIPITSLLYDIVVGIASVWSIAMAVILIVLNPRTLAPEESEAGKYNMVTKEGEGSGLIGRGISEPGSSSGVE